MREGNDLKLAYEGDNYSGGPDTDPSLGGYKVPHSGTCPDKLAIFTMMIMKVTAILSRSALTVLTVSCLTSAACEGNERSVDAQAFELILDDVARLAKSKPEVNPRGFSGQVSAEVVAERSRLLRARNIKEVNDVGSRGCPGMTSITTDEAIRANCPKTPASIVVINDLVRGIQGAAVGLGNADVSAPVDAYSIHVSVYDIAARGSQFQDYVYIMKSDGKHLSIVQRVPEGMS